MTRIIFQQEPENVHDSRPWAVLFEGGRVIYGRPDATAIIGFSILPKPGGEMLTTAIGIEKPEDIVGTYPVFIDGGRMFVDTRPIAEAKVWLGDDAGAESLAASERTMREALESAGAVAVTHTVIGTRSGFGQPTAVAAIRGRHDVEHADDDTWVTYVQTLNAADALSEAQEQMELADQVGELADQMGRGEL